MKNVYFVALLAAFSFSAFGQNPTTVVGTCDVAVQPCKVASPAPLTGQAANISTPVVLFTNNTGASVQLAINANYWQTTVGTGTLLMTITWNDGKATNNSPFGQSCDLSTSCHPNLTQTVELASGQVLSYTTSGYTSGAYSVDVTVTRTR